ETATAGSRIALAIAVDAGERTALLDIRPIGAIRTVHRPRMHWPCGGLHHHDLRPIGARRFGECVALGTKAREIHLSLSRFKPGRRILPKASCAGSHRIEGSTCIYTCCAAGVVGSAGVVARVTLVARLLRVT